MDGIVQEQDHESAQSISVLSLNCWGLWLVAKYRQPRIQAIAAYLLEPELEVDIVGLQEIWLSEDYSYLCDRLRPKYPHAYYFRSGVIGSGLAVFSRHPIIEVSCRRFSVNGKPQRIFHGDYLGGKAIGLCRIRHPAGTVDFYNTHLHARYAENPAKDEYAAHRVGQAWEVVRFIRHTARHHVILVGDLNMDPRSLVYQLVTTPMSKYGGGGLTDTWQETRKSGEKTTQMKQDLKRELKMDNEWDPPLEGAASTITRSPYRSVTKQDLYKDAVTGMTCGAVTNSFTPVSKKAAPPERIDYVFYLRTSHFQCSYARVAAVERLSAINCSLSDHYGMLARFKVAKQLGPNRSGVFEMPPDYVLQAIHQSPCLSAEALESPGDGEVHMKLKQMDPFIDCKFEEVLISVIKVLTWGIWDARKREDFYTLNRYLMAFITIGSLIAGIVLACVSWKDVDEWTLRLCWIVSFLLEAVGVGGLFYFSIMSLFVLPEELSALERIRSEIVLWVTGHRPSSSSQQFLFENIPASNDTETVMDKTIANAILRVAGVSEPASLSPPFIPHEIASSVPPTVSQDRRQRAQTVPARLSTGLNDLLNQVRSPPHLRRPSNMADPGPIRMTNEMAAFNALSTALRFGSADHPASMVNAVEDALKDFATQTQQVVENLGRSRRSLTSDRLNMIEDEAHESLPMTDRARHSRSQSFGGSN